VAGHDVAFGGTSLGVALGGGWGSYSLDNGFGQGTTGSFHAGLRGTQEFGAAYLSGALAYGYHAFSTSRTVTGERYDADYTGHSLSGRAEAGWRVAVLPGSTFTPYGAVETVALFTPSYGENASGAGLFALNYQAQETVSTRLELGARLEHVIALGDKPLTLSGRAAYQHNLDPQRDVTAGFATLASTQLRHRRRRRFAQQPAADAGRRLCAGQQRQPRPGRRRRHRRRKPRHRGPGQLQGQVVGSGRLSRAGCARLP
jgi:uncharacterized protein with beta-barrel porin domain